MYDCKDKELFAILYETASTAGIEIIEDRLNRRGGVCSVEGRVHVIFDEKAPVREKNRLILHAISRMDVDSVYMPPRVREMLGRQETGSWAQDQEPEKYEDTQP